MPAAESMNHCALWTIGIRVSIRPGPRQPFSAVSVQTPSKDTIFILLCRHRSITLSGCTVETGTLPRILARNTLLCSSCSHSMRGARDNRRVPLEGWRPNDPCTFVYPDSSFTNTRPAGSEYSIVELRKFEQNHHGALVGFCWVRECSVRVFYQQRSWQLTI